MRVKEYQLDELKRARALQDEAAKLHIPVPVLSYQYEIADTDGNIEEKGIGKSNSYTRNALNAIAWIAGLCDTSINTNVGGIGYGDGHVVGKGLNGGIYGAEYLIRATTSTEPYIMLGTSSAAESINDYSIITSSLSSGVAVVGSVFNSTTRKLITTISKTFVNSTAGTINITESGVAMNFAAANSFLYIRDVFTAIPVEPGKTITWTYVTEVAYPEP